MGIKRISSLAAITLIALIYSACVPTVTQRAENKNVPDAFRDSRDTVNTAIMNWRDFFVDPYLKALIDSALRRNQELNIITQEINVAKQEVRARKGEYLPFVNVTAGAGVEKVGNYTRNGSVEETNEIAPGKPFPDPLPNLTIAANVSWEVDVWKKLRNAKKAATYRYLSTAEGRNFMVTMLVAEVSNAYYDLMALDNQLQILQRNIEIQQNALAIVKLEKIAAKVTELAVRKFEAEVLKNQSRQYDIKQAIIEKENEINFLVGRFPQPVLRNSQSFSELVPDSIQAGIPSQLLENRRDIKQAELDLEAAKLDVKSARAQFYPQFMITGGFGFEAFNASYLMKTPESMIYALTGGLMQPLVNRNGIKANYYSANSKQVQAMYNYERTILRAYIEVANQLSNIDNLKRSYDLRAKQVAALNRSIQISTGLFKSARADYMEVLMTQRDALEARFELVETKKEQMNAMVNVYQALGGGWN
jgi:NodT family efflux transporter outer membrane factor (OMF) lipoprotein